MTFENESCLNCSKTATWIRKTQFAGDHPFCSECAILEQSKGTDDEIWFLIEPEEKT